MPIDIRRKEKEDRIASYTFTDILTGKTYIHYYGSSNGEAITSTHLLTGFTCYSEDISTTITPPSYDTMNFDSPVTSTFVVDGTAIFSCTVKKGGANDTVIVSGSVLRIRNGNETDLGEVRIGNIVSGDAVDEYRITSHITLTKTRFKNGDTLRFRLKIKTAGAVDWKIFHDPKNRKGSLDDATVGSTLDVYIPFNVNL